MKADEDYNLIADYLAGNKGSFETLFNRHKNKLYGYLNTQLPWAKSEVDDLFQQTWVKAIKSFTNYHEQGCFSAWLIRIGQNLIIDRHRKNQRSTPIVSLDNEENSFQPSCGHGTEPWRDLDESELSKHIKSALLELPLEQREVFLWRQEGVSFREIAARQNCPLNTALARMQYALKSLRLILSKIDEGGLLQ